MDQSLAGIGTEQPLAEMPGLAGQYLRFCSAHLGSLEEYIAQEDLVSVSRIAHALSGNAARIGLSELSSLGHQLEEYCVGEDWSGIGLTYREIAETISKLCAGTAVPIEVQAKPVRGGQAVAVRNAS